MQDLGNPNFFKIFQGKGEVALHDGVTSANPGVMLSLTNELQFLGDYEVGVDGIIGVLPEGYRPNTEIIIPVVAVEGSASRLTMLHIMDDGTLVSDPNSSIKTHGIVVNLSGNWY